MLALQRGLGKEATQSSVVFLKSYEGQQHNLCSCLLPRIRQGAAFAVCLSRKSRWYFKGKSREVQRREEKVERDLRDSIGTAIPTGIPADTGDGTAGAKAEASQ